ncbi:hypothetical protein [Corynebacterium tapiri]|uniref:Uncharacterized protein n=1 Tax=Corynebacterium tapiri TaxID=1448266 RepID=A0A5C4U2Q8_9CORY|nr:hypothetical protein [Corynebacterium tapiri]TNL96773.1 hypothetical protein FHE74_07050 [Corynebacterium tapiri]
MRLRTFNNEVNMPFGATISPRRKIAAVALAIMTVIPVSGCGYFSGWIEKAETSPSGNTAVSLDDSGAITVHMVACDIQVESIEINIESDTPGKPLTERIDLDEPAGGYIAKTLPRSTSHEPPVLDIIMNDPQQQFWIAPITYKVDSDEKRFVPWIYGLTMSELEKYPRGSLIDQKYVPPSEARTPGEVRVKEEVSLDQFKHGESSTRPENCHVD